MLIGTTALQKLAVTLVATTAIGGLSGFISLSRSQSATDARVTLLEVQTTEQRKLETDINTRLGSIQSDVGEIKGEVKVIVSDKLGSSMADVRRRP